jgi:hypothetical protein
MPYVCRDTDGNIISISLEKSASHSELLEADNAELSQFMTKLNLDSNQILETDIALIRVIEDLIDILIAKSVINFNDLPSAVQKKLLNRKNLRMNAGLKSKDDLIKL